MIAGRPLNEDKTGLVLSEGQELFLEWLVDPERKGSQNEFAAKVGVSNSTLSKWKRDPSFRDRWDQRLAELNIQPDRIQRVVESLYEAAIGGGQQSVKAMELYLRYVDKFTPKTEVVSSAKAARDLSDEDLANMGENIAFLRQAK